MILRTSYFANLKVIQSIHETVPLCISIIKPRWLDGSILQYKQLAPTWELVNDLKNNRITEKGYTTIYEQMLDKLDPHEISKEFMEMGNDITLLCYEKSGFCHRKIAGTFLFEGSPLITKLIRG